MGTDGDEDEGSKTPMVDACWKVMVVEEEDVNRGQGHARGVVCVVCVEGEKKEKKGKVFGRYVPVCFPSAKRRQAGHRTGGSGSHGRCSDMAW